MHFGTALIFAAVASCASATAVGQPGNLKCQHSNGLVYQHRDTESARADLLLPEIQCLHMKTTCGQAVGPRNTEVSADEVVVHTQLDGGQETVDLDDINTLIHACRKLRTDCECLDIDYHHCCVQEGELTFCRTIATDEVAPSEVRLKSIAHCDGTVRKVEQFEDSELCARVHPHCSQAWTNVGWSYNAIKWYQLLYQRLARYSGMSMGGKPSPRNEEVVTECLERAASWTQQPQREPETSLKKLDLRRRVIDSATNFMTVQKTVTAPPAGTTTVYIPGTLPTAKTMNALFAMTQMANLQGPSDEPIMTQISQGTTVTTTAIIQTSVVTTIATDPYGPRTSNMTPNDTSIDTSSYINISTFIASNLPIETSDSTTLAFNSTVASLLRSAMSMTSTIFPSSESTSKGITTATKTFLPPLPSQASGAKASVTVTLDSKARLTIAASSKDDGGAKVFGTMAVGMGLCFVLALFL